MAEDLIIETIPSENKPEDKRIKNMNYKNLPKLPATFCVLGRCGSGKSSILYSLLTKGYTYGKNNKSVFDEAIIYLGSQDSIHAFEKIPIENKIVLQEFDAKDFDEYLEDLKTHQMDRLEKGKAPMNACYIFDDFVGRGLTKPLNGKSSPLERLALTSRHEAHASIFFCAQVYKNSGFASCTVRNNITTYIISQMTRPEIEKIAEENSQDYTQSEFIEMYDRVMAKKPYNFIVIDMRRPLNRRITEQFHIPVPRPPRLLELDKLAGI